MSTSATPRVHFTVDLPFTMPMYCRPTQVPRHTTRDRSQVTCHNCVRKLARWEPVQEDKKEETT